MLLQIHEPGQTPLPHEGHKSAAVGIDLGTTNSVVAVSEAGKADVLRDEHGRGLIPSVVCYAEDGSAIVGEDARRALLDRPDAVVSSIKRLMGRGPEEVKALAGALPYQLDTKTEGMVRLVVGGRSLSPVEISADILRAVKARAEASLGHAVTRAVVTVPAYFDDGARTATRDAARLAGLEVLRLVAEPTAAALAYGLDSGAEGLYAVFDLGGGTFDISLLHLEKGVFQVRATGGDAALGGDDIDHRVAEHFLAERARALGGAHPTQAEVKQVLAAARLAKECLSAQLRGEWVIELGSTMSRHPFDRAALEQIAEPFVARTVALTKAVLADAAVAPSEVKGVVLVGGSTRMPIVRRAVAALFGREPLADINPEEVVAVGAALQAEALTSGSDTLLLDVTPLSLGVETMGGIVETLIPRNTPIPVAMAQEFTTWQDGQDAMLIHVVQGEREMVDLCRSLARFALAGIPPMVAGAARIRVAFQVDADGLLTVSAREATTGIEQRVEVKPSYGLTEDEMAAMLRASLEHGEEDMLARLLAEARVEAERTLLAVRAALTADSDLLSSGERAAIESAMERVAAQLPGSDRDAIAAAAAALEEATQVFAERRMDRGIKGALAGVSVDRLEAGLAGKSEAG